MLSFGRGDLVRLLFSIKLYFSTEPKKIPYQILERSRKINYWFFLFLRFLLISLASLYSHDLVGQDQGNSSS
jgi:hypothetical protein